MQGRLTDKGGFFPQEFPLVQWEQEFATAAEIGFQCIEWMFNFEQWENNPIICDDGVATICKLIKDTGIVVSGICANYFMRRSIFDAQAMEENINILRRLVKNAEVLKCSNIIIPLFEASEMQPESETFRNILAQIANENIMILLETDCDMKSMYQWLQKVDCENIGICYDIGNATGLARDTVREVHDYTDIIKNVHIKDKKKYGKTVMLGQGDGRIEETMKVLLKNGYQGCFILESYYGTEAIEDTRKNYNYIKDFLRV